MKNYRTYINNVCVGSGHWLLKSIKSYCTKKGIELKSAQYMTYDINYGFDYHNIDLSTGFTSFLYNSDPLRSMLGL